jgi:hypothetical protein
LVMAALPWVRACSMACKWLSRLTSWRCISLKFLQRSAARFSISCYMVVVAESMDRLVSGYQCKSPVVRGPPRGSG